MKILVNTVSTKKHSGGAFQIASNFLTKTLDCHDVEWSYFVSSDLDEILPAAIKCCSNYYVFPTQPDFFHSYNKVKRELRELERAINPNIVYTITAPSYFSFNSTEVMRFTNPLVAHPNCYSWKVQPLLSKIRLKVYCWNQKRLIRKARFFITQTETTKKGLLQITGLPEKHVRVVSNVLPAAFSHQDRNHIVSEDSWIDVACVGAPVPHKNFDILPLLLIELQKIGVDNVRFHTTIPEDNPIWHKIESCLKYNHLQKHIVNYGRLTQSELADMYRHCTFAYLPTLLEVFSASALEAMFFDLKIVATDFAFNYPKYSPSKISLALSKNLGL